MIHQRYPDNQGMDHALRQLQEIVLPRLLVLVATRTPSVASHVVLVCQQGLCFASSVAQHNRLKWDKQEEAVQSLRQPHAVVAFP